MSRDPDMLAEETVGVLRDMEIPDQLKHSIATYQEHLSDLAASLLAEGFDDETVERSLKRPLIPIARKSCALSS